MGKRIYLVSTITPEYFKHAVRWEGDIIFTPARGNWEQHPEILRTLNWYLYKMNVLLSNSEILKSCPLAQPQQESVEDFSSLRFLWICLSSWLRKASAGRETQLCLISACGENCSFPRKVLCGLHRRELSSSSSLESLYRKKFETQWVLSKKKTPKLLVKVGIHEVMKLFLVPAWERCLSST